MKAPPSPSPALLCEILAPRAAQAASFAKIAGALALDVGQPIEVRTATTAGDARLSRNEREPVLTLHLPAALAATQNQVWCLACRLACFCPGIRVSVLIQSETTFAPAALPKRQRDPRAA